VGSGTRTWDHVLFNPVGESIGESLLDQKKIILVSESYFCRFFIVGFEGERGDYGLDGAILSIKSFFCRLGAMRNREGTTLEGMMS
jgi:hypothetical protein